MNPPFTLREKMSLNEFLDEYEYNSLQELYFNSGDSVYRYSEEEDEFGVDIDSINTLKDDVLYYMGESTEIVIKCNSTVYVLYSEVATSIHDLSFYNLVQEFGLKTAIELSSL